MLKTLTRDMLQHALPSLGDSLYRIHGFAVYKGVIILWDDCYDRRIREVIDVLEELGCAGQVIAAHKHVGPVMIFWDDLIPACAPESFRVPMVPQGKALWQAEHHLCPRDAYDFNLPTEMP